MLDLIPGYAWTKTVMSSFAGNEEVEEQCKPVLVTLDDQLLPTHYKLPDSLQS